jgi:ubiquitin-protein ligase
MSSSAFPSRNIKLNHDAFSECNGQLNNKRILVRLNREVQNMLKPDNDLSKAQIYVSMPTNEIWRFKILMGGVKDTPYEGGLFKYNLYVPNTYPIRPPICHFGSALRNVRFNPNYYVDGKICLSVLGTWGDDWCAATNIESVLYIIQERMNENPMINEPGHEEDPKYKKENCEEYNNLILYETIKITIVEQFEYWNSYNMQKILDKDTKTLTKIKNDKSEIEFELELIPKAIELFKQYYDTYLTNIKKLEDLNLEGKVLKSMWFEDTLKLKKLREDLEKVKKIVDKLIIT